MMNRNKHIIEQIIIRSQCGNLDIRPRMPVGSFEPKMVIYKDGQEVGYLPNPDDFILTFNSEESGMFILDPGNLALPIMDDTIERVIDELVFLVDQL